MARNKKKKIISLSGRMAGVILWVALLIISVAGSIFATSFFRTEFFESFKYENRSAVETMVSNINQVYREYEDGAIDETVGRELAVLMVQNGVWNNGQRGFWALEQDGTLVAKVENGDMTYKPGDNVWDYQDADGRYVERELIEAGLNGGGYVEFRISNESVDNTYVGYALKTDFGFVVDATFDMNYFDKYFNESIMTNVAKIIASVVACYIVVLAALLLMSRPKMHRK